MGQKPHELPPRTMKSWAIMNLTTDIMSVRFQILLSVLHKGGAPWNDGRSLTP